MIQYIINATAIWLVSLVVFDLWLRKSTLHTYNRAYLIITALLGALLPFYHASPQVASLSPVFVKPMIAVAGMKQSISAATAVPHTSFPWPTWILGAYILGIVVSCSLLLREGFILFRWYRSADVQRHGDARLVTTHRAHGPFSVLGYIFISDAAAYTADELRFILQHEGVHIQRRHYLDKALMLLLRCIFWLNPLIYIYYNRLMMVHEYEADETARPTSRDYGHFLIQQHLTGATPLIAHSFFHSPLKSRIRMLTATRSRAWRKAAYVLLLPAIAAFAILWVNNSTARKRVQQGNIVTFGENKFEMGLPMINGKPASPDTMIMNTGGGSGSDKKADYDPAMPETNADASADHTVQPDEFSIVVTLDSIPVKMNGQQIYDVKQLSSIPALHGRSQSLLTLIVKGAQEEMNMLPAGIYQLEVYSLVVDKSGHVVYYKVSPVYLKAGTFELAPGKDINELEAAAKKEKEAHPIDELLKMRITNAVEQTLDALILIPGKKDGQPVIAQVDISPGYGEVIVVRNHKARVERNR